MQCNWLLEHFDFCVFKQPVLSMHIELLGCLAIHCSFSHRRINGSLK